MKIPLPPPDMNHLLQGLKELPFETISQIIGTKPTDGKGRYLYWDKLRYMPHPEGLTQDQYWLGMKLARQATLKNLPLVDNEQQSFRFTTPDSVLKMLHEIDRDASGHIQMAEPITDSYTRDMYLIKSLVEEAINSSQLEGASTTRQVAKEMIRLNRKPRTRGEQMILNNYRAMQFVREMKDEKLTPGMVFELHRIVTENTLDDENLAGRFRTQSENIQVVDLARESILHTPPHPDELPERMKRLCNFANKADTQLFVHPVIRAILLHFMLGYDHPFVDGNGRTARALFYWSMANQGYWLTEFITISGIIKKAPAQYGYAFLYSEIDDNDTTYFIIHQLNVIQKAIVELHQYLARKAKDSQEAIKLLGKTHLIEQLNHRQIALIEHALKNPGTLYRIKEHKNVHNSTYETARTDLMSLSEKFGLFLKLKEGRTFAFIAPVDLRERIQRRSKS